MGERLRVALLIGASRAYRRDLLHGIAAYARLHGYWSFYHQERSPGEEAPAWLKRWQGHGIIAQIENSKLAEQIRELHLPAVDLFGLHRIDGVAAFDNDSRAIAEMAADHLLERGFEHFAYCGLPGVHYADECGGSFAKYLSQKGYCVSVYDLPRPGYRVAASRAEVKELSRERALGEWLQSLPKPVGLMACNDLRAQQVLTSCAEYGIAVPDDVAVIGADNDDVLCELSDPPLSSIDPNARAMGYEAAALLEGMIQGEPPPAEKIRVKPLGVVTRQSSDILAVADPAVAAAVRFIREHALSGVRVEEVSRHVQLSRSTLERRFAKVLGRSPKDEILRLQLDRMKQLLAKTDYSLLRIAHMVGFAHVENMCKFFKARTGQTLGAFRKTHTIPSAR